MNEEITIDEYKTSINCFDKFTSFFIYCDNVEIWEIILNAKSVFKNNILDLNDFLNVAKFD